MGIKGEAASTLGRDGGGRTLENGSLVDHCLQITQWSSLTWTSGPRRLASPPSSPTATYPPVLPPNASSPPHGHAYCPIFVSLLPASPPLLHPPRSFHYRLWDLNRKATSFWKPSQILLCSHHPLPANSPGGICIFGCVIYTCT